MDSHFLLLRETLYLLTIDVISLLHRASFTGLCKILLSVPLISFNDLHVCGFSIWDFRQRRHSKTSSAQDLKVTTNSSEEIESIRPGDACCFGSGSSLKAQKIDILSLSFKQLNLTTKANEIIAKWISRTSNVVRFIDGCSCTLVYTN